MFERIIKYIVYVLSFLLIISFFAVIYGIYIKISHKSPKNYKLDRVNSLLLNENQEIINLQVIDNNRVFITISDGTEMQGIIFDIDNQEIIQRIKK